MIDEYASPSFGGMKSDSIEFNAQCLKLLKENENELKKEYKERYFDPETGAHFKFEDVCTKLLKV